MAQPEEAQGQKKNPLREIVQPFIDLYHAPRALWGINLPYMLEGMVYFGFLGYLAIHFSSFIFRGMENADIYSHNMVMVLTAGITIAMFFLGFVADKWGVRRALIIALLLMLAGRILISGAPTIFGLEPAGLWSSLHLVTMAGILIVVVGYGMYMPAAYAGVRQFTTPKTAGMAFAMLYALMNLGGYFPSGAFLLRDERYLNLGIPGVFWVYTAFTVLALVITFLVLSRSTIAAAVARAKAESAEIQKGQEANGTRDEAGAGAKRDAKKDAGAGAAPAAPVRTRIPVHMWGVYAGLLVAAYFIPGELGGIPLHCFAWTLLVAGLIVIALLPAPQRKPVIRWIAEHPLADGKFFFFIFSLIPVQTLFTYNWFVLPQYVSRAYVPPYVPEGQGWIGEFFELASNLNPILIFILVPIIAAVTQRRNVYNMMIAGTAVMALPAFLPAIAPHFLTLFGYILIMTIGEAMWQPRFLQYAAEIAPEGQTGKYMGVAQLPWFLTKVLVPLIYSGYMIQTYCPPEGDQNTETMWFYFGCIAVVSPILLLLGKRWVGKDFKTKA